jgi:hypothetical protein
VDKRNELGANQIAQRLRRQRFEFDLHQFAEALSERRCTRVGRVADRGRKVVRSTCCQSSSTSLSTMPVFASETRGMSSPVGRHTQRRSTAS